MAQKPPPSSAGLRSRFWEKFALDDLNDAEWEALCDGCGRCCLQKLEDQDSGVVHVTDLACAQLDTNNCRCKDYTNRQKIVPDCLNVRPLNDDKLRWLPASCAYRRLAEGRELAQWHPLISGDPNSVHQAGIGMAGRCVSEQLVPLHEWPRRVLDWDDS